MSSEQICFQVSPKLFGVNSWIPQMSRQWISSSSHLQTLVMALRGPGSGVRTCQPPEIIFCLHPWPVR